jgi:hypothetical protein
VHDGFVSLVRGVDRPFNLCEEQNDSVQPVGIFSLAGEDIA